MPACPNCGTDIPEGQALCPHCGARRAAPEAWPPPPETSPGGPGVWPPPPSSLVPEPLPPERLLTGRRWLDVTLGIVASFAGLIGITALGSYVAGVSTEGLLETVGILLCIVGVTTPLLLASGLRTRLPLVAKGARWSLIVIAAVLLGALTMCFIGLSGMGH